ncbi:hypothetical protein [Chitinophaga arvensicola]|nr:hypothetical protein [Chitinophaga arvensicola]
MAQHTPAFKVDSFHLAGNISRYDPAGSPFQLLKVVYNTPYGQQDQVIAQLDKSGNFNATIPLFNPQELMLDFDHTLIYLYAVPEKSLHLTLDTADIRRVNTVNDLVKLHTTQQVISFKGSTAGINTNLHDYMYHLGHVINPVSNEQVQGMTADQYLTWRIQKMQIQLDSLQVWRRTNRLLHMFHTRTLQYIRYSAGADILAYWYDHSNRQALPPPSYQHFIATLPVNNNEVLTDVYYDFINNYLIYLHRKNHNNTGGSMLHYITQQINKGPGQDLLLANLAADSLQHSQQLQSATIQYLRQHLSNTAISDVSPILISNSIKA